MNDALELGVRPERAGADARDLVAMPLEKLLVCELVPALGKAYERIDRLHHDAAGTGIP